MTAEREQRKTRRTGSRVYRYMASYVILLLLPCLFAWITYSTFFNDLLGEVNATTLSGMETAVDEIDDAMDQMYHYFFQIYNNASFHEYATSQSGYARWRLVDLLKVYSESTRYIADYGIWDSEADKIYTPDGSFSDQVYLRYMLHSAADGAFQALEAARFGLYECADTNQQVFFYVCPMRVFSNRTDSVKGAFFFYMTENDLARHIGGLINSAGTLEISLDSPAATGVSQSKGMTVYTVSSAESGLSLRLCLSSNSLPDRLFSRRRTFMALMLVTVVVSILLSVWMSINNMRPIRRLLNVLQHSNVADHPTADELSRIADITGDLLVSNDEMGQRISEQKNTLRQQALMLLLHGTFDQTTLDTLERIGIAVEDRACFVALVYATGSREARLNDDILDMLELLVCPAGIEAYPVELEQIRAVAALVTIETADRDARTLYAQILQNAAAARSLTLGVNLGGIVAGVRQASLSLGEAQSLGMDAEGVHLFRAPSQKLPVWQGQSSKEMICLLQALRNGSRQGVEAGLDQVLSEIDSQVQSALMRRCACFEMFNGIVRELAALNVNVGFEDVEQLLGGLWDETAVSQLKALLRDACDHIGQDAARKSAQRDNEVVQYVQEHLGDAELCVDLLIDRFGISGHQISRIFRQKTGYGFREYLISQRMMRAKELVLSSEQSIAEITAAVGYSNASYFIKTFKLYYGMTPTQLKKQSASISQD